MVSDYPSELRLPRDWQGFEDFCLDLVRAEWGDSAQLNGRSGQDQNGVDIYVQTEEGWLGFQCKKKRGDKDLQPNEVEDEADAARRFDPPLSRFFIFTTSLHHNKAQAAARLVTQRHLEEDPPRFPVEIRFWNELEEILEKHRNVAIRWRRRLSLAAAEPKISTSQLPTASPEELIGRDAELERLDEAWSDPKIHALSLIAIGGAGKTSLVDHWLQRVEQDDWRGAEVVFVWSFYSQGAGEDRQASGDQLIDAALRFFGDPEPREGSPRDRGVRLARRVRERHTLLVLDGLEPIQHPPNHARRGRIKDPGVAALVRELASSQPGLLVITSRQQVKDLENRRRSTAPVIDLDRLSTEAGVHLLGRFGVDGKAEDLDQVVDEVHGHALTLTLLGTYLKAAHKGDVRAWHDLPHLEQAELIGDSHASKVMAAYAEWFGEGPERQILSFLGLFDRPADAAALAALRRPPAIQGLTDQLVELSTPQWNIALDRLRKARLVLEAEPARPGELDAHPLVREHFGRVLEREHPKAYRQGHRRLYEHYAATAPDLPATLPAMAPLYRAIGHGCRAGRRQEAYDEVYWRRIRRGDEAYSVKKLGAFGSDLTALASFFESPWARPAEELRLGDRGWLLNAAGFCLRALGRLEEAVEPLEAALELGLEQDDLKNAARVAGNLSELTLTLGAVDRSLKHARRSVELADRSGDEFERISYRTTPGDALHAAGRLDEAESAFREAEVLRGKLYSLPGYRVCDFMLSRAAPLDGSGLGRASLRAAPENARRLCEEVVERARSAIKIASRNRWLLDIALDHLSLGRAKLGLALATDGALDAAKADLDQAVERLRKAGYEEFLIRGLLARATLYRFHANEPAAETDLAEALEIAERGSMRLHECDAHLEWGRLRHAVGDREGARGHLEAARKIVEATGYGRRERETRELAGVLGVEDGGWGRGLG